ncbi:biotin--[acetyl-CoA-carboxylase] ligase [Aureibacter tunicatorum]|uniref:BirA family biotin operon repressor/biotin-[acetyl-CoA-carboxylase] ligase n=1 Tax=Aureibacter tunicatorum TaxID=866807 RepID=A0AAE3XJT1_9BACT|nr:biotin--[acetyl-CoA-carboxylase] ligase [Aureibacter tunicatorum]MDR6237770.1 BirA family biotin operon repressor/biotin-[acetyl-CoA-carboxylase] ligase [Aureibacter tunicatorum]BDD02805.1 biotin--[acetyl-CoA-carboxylase] ligase [Aureibacter tunicatorum]
MHIRNPNSFIIGKQLIELESCSSTNTEAVKMAQNGDAQHGTVVLTNCQTSGKGQRGNVWEAASGQNLTFSIVLHPQSLHISDQFFLSMLTSLSIYDFLSEYLLEEDLKIKWPNDIYFEDTKMGGILIESIAQGEFVKTSVVGIGVNINQKEFVHPQAKSLAMICGQEFDLREMLTLFLEFFTRRYRQLENLSAKSLHQEYYSKLYWYDEIHTFQDLQEQYFMGRIKGVNELGCLIVERENDTKEFDIKEIKFIK